MLQEEHLAIRLARQPGPETARKAARGFGGDGLEVLAPLVAVGRIDELEVEANGRQLVVGEGAAELDVLRILALWLQDEHISAGDGPGKGVQLLPVEENLGLGIDLEDVVLGDGQDAPGAAAAVIDGAGHALGACQLGIEHEHEIDHQADAVARGKVLAGVFVEGFVEFAEQVLEDVTHLVVGHGGGAQVHFALLIETLHQQVEQIHPPEVADGVVEVKRGEDFPDIGREAHDILAKVQSEVGIVMQEALVIEFGSVVEGVSGSAAQLPVAVLQALLLQRVLGLQHLGLGRLQRVIESP